MISIQTNVNSLIAQQNLGVNSAFQSKTIQQLTSGYRINSSGDDAAGLAVANKFRNSVAELTQGVANGNDGLAQLQIMDGGMTNISQILDRLKTLSMQSASASFTSSRVPLNQEFQSDLAELDRQAQSIGLNTGGTFAKSLAIYLGAGSGSGTGSTNQTNSTVTVDLSTATVDSQSLGLTGMQTGNTGFDLSTSMINTIKANESNQTANGTATAQFKLYGPGFGDGVNINVALGAAGKGVVDGATLASAVNTAITAAGVSNAGLAAASITASVVANSSNGQQMLTFTAASTVFQVRAGDQMANAFLGNSDSAGLGTALQSKMAGNAYGSNFASADTLSFSVSGGGLSAPVTFNLSATSGSTAAQTATAIQNYVNTGNTTAAVALRAAGITVDTAGTLNFLSSTGAAVNVSLTGDSLNTMGYGSYLGTTDTDHYTATTAFTASTDTPNTVTFDLSIGGAAPTKLDVTAASGATFTETAALAAINAAIAGNTAFQKAGIIAKDNGSAIELISTNGTNFRLGVRNNGSGTSFGFYTEDASHNVDRSTVAAYTGLTKSGGNISTQNAQGEYQLAKVVSGVNTAAPFDFTGITNGADVQSLTLAASDASGGQHSTVITLAKNTGVVTDLNQAGDIDQAISSINKQIQATTDTTLKSIYAVKVRYNGTDQIEFQSSVQNFSVNVGKTNSGAGVAMTSGTLQGVSATSLKVGSGGAADISTLANATAAVQAITSAVAALGSAQATVGKGQNQLNYAINLAQSQITNFSAAESQIRDTNVAQQAANLSKAQVLQQASIAAMAQANSAPQGVLALLKG
jgi:flagellin